MQDNDKPLYAGVDFGTSGCRLVLINAQKLQVHSQQLHYPDPNKQSPLVWWTALSELLSSCPLALKKRIQSIAVDGTSGTLLLTDQQGEPSSITLMYNDARAIAEARQIAQIAPVESGAQGASSSLARLMWLLKNYSHTPHSYVLHQADWVMGKLSGQFGVSDENNSLKLQY